MIKPISIGVVLAMFVSPTFATEQCWIVHQHHCRKEAQEQHNDRRQGVRQSGGGGNVQ